MSTNQDFEPNKKQKVDNKCSYINPSKNNKRCGLQVRKGQTYCFAHINKVESAPQNENEITKKGKNGEIIRRVICSVDPSHTVWEDRLTKHLKICNAVKERLEIEHKEETCDWFSINYNLQDLEKPEETLDAVINEDDWRQFMHEVTAKYNEIFTVDLALQDGKYTKGLEGRLEEVSNQKHILQQSSLIEKLIDHDLIDVNAVVVEFGCGRAEFSRYHNKAMIETFKNSKKYKPQYLLIDRAVPRLKFDKKMIADAEEFEIKNAEIRRLKVDIKDFKLAESLKTFPSQQFIGISKHLCGVATDLTLRCLLNAIEDDPEIKFKGCVIAMCCRHCCKYEWLLNESKEYLKKFGIDQSNFIYFKKMFAWATNGIKPGVARDAVNGHHSGLSYEQREIVGLKMRRILDESRKYAMEKRGFNVEIVKYIDRSISLEDNCIIIK